MTVRFETRGSGPGSARTFADDDPAINHANPVDSLDWPEYVDGSPRDQSRRTSAPARRRHRRRVNPRPARPSAAPGPAAGRSVGTTNAPASTSARPGPYRADTVRRERGSTPRPRRRRAVPPHAVDERRPSVAGSQGLQHDAAGARGHACVERDGVGSRRRRRRCPPAARRPRAELTEVRAALDAVAPRVDAPRSRARPAGGHLVQAQRLPTRCRRSSPAHRAPRAAGSRGHRQRVAQIARARRLRARRRCAGAGQHHRASTRRRSASSHSAVSSMVSVPWVTTTPSAPVRRRPRTAAPIRSQSPGVSCELSTAIRSTTSTSRPLR